MFYLVLRISFIEGASELQVSVTRYFVIGFFIWFIAASIFLRTKYRINRKIFLSPRTLLFSGLLTIILRIIAVLSLTTSVLIGFWTFVR